MPIFVQWKWQEKTKSFLVIFHFYDDYSKPNIRFKEIMLRGKGNRVKFYHPVEMEIPDVVLPNPSIWPHQRKMFMTWASSHLELALLSQLLHYANRIDGLSNEEKRSLRNKLEIVYGSEDEPPVLDEKNLLGLDSNLPYQRFLIGYESTELGKKRIINCFEICPEYIDYLKEVLKPCLK